MYSSKLEIEKLTKYNLIKNFIKDNNRIPNSGELNDLLKEKYKINIDQYGYQDKISLSKINSISSYKNINTICNNYYNNNVFFMKQFEELFDKISQRALLINTYCTLLERDLQKLNNRATSFMLSKGYSSNLLSSITEDFITDSKLILESSEVSCSSNGIQAFQNSNSNLTDYISSINYYVFSDSTYNKVVSNGELDSLKSVDGKFWQVDVYTDYNNGNISVQIELELTELINTTSLKLALASYSGLSISCYIANEDKNYSFLSSQGVNSDLCEFTINSDIKYIKLLLINNKANLSTDKEYIYSFKLDSISLESKTLNNNCIFYCGPYEFKNYMDETIKFNYVQLETCTNISDKSSIDYYISTDNETWISISPKDSYGSGTIVSLNSTSDSVDLSVIDSTLGVSNLDYNNIGEIINKQTDCYLNVNLDASFIDSINENNILIKRNIPNNKDIYTINSGWFYDNDDNLYKTIIEINNFDGIRIDFGSSSVYIDDILVSGSNLITAGIHTFATTQDNWLSIPSDLSTEKEIIANDPLYPYNHKLLIEGYTYPATFSGNKYYNGIDSYYGKILKYVNKAEFDLRTDDLDIFTIDIKNNLIYIIVHVYNQYEDWENEEYDINIYLSTNQNTSLYLKGIFRNDSLSTEILKNFTLRVG